MNFQELPDGKTLYTTFVEFAAGHLWDDSIKKSYFAPVRGHYSVRDDKVYAGDYVIHEDGTIEGLNNAEPPFDPIEDIVRFPGFVMHPALRKYLRDRGFWMKTSNVLYLTVLPGVKIGDEVITDGKTPFLST